MQTDLIIIADAFGKLSGDPTIPQMMRDALSNRRPAQDPEEAMRHFGGHLDAVLKMCEPLVSSIDEMLPGFQRWLDDTGYGDDVAMIKTMLTIVSVLEAMNKPNDVRSLWLKSQYRARPGLPRQRILH